MLTLKTIMQSSTKTPSASTTKSQTFFVSDNLPTR